MTHFNYGSCGIYSTSKYITFLKSIKIIDGNQTDIVLIEISQCTYIDYLLVKGYTFRTNLNMSNVQKAFIQAVTSCQFIAGMDLTINYSYIKAKDIVLYSIESLTIDSIKCEAENDQYRDGTSIRGSIDIRGSPNFPDDDLFVNNYICNVKLQKCECKNKQITSNMIFRRR